MKTSTHFLAVFATIFSFSLRAEIGYYQASCVDNDDYLKIKGKLLVDADKKNADFSDFVLFEGGEDEDYIAAEKNIIKSEKKYKSDANFKFKFEGGDSHDPESFTLYVAKKVTKNTASFSVYVENAHTGFQKFSGLCKLNKLNIRK